MAGTKAGAIKLRETMIKKYGSEEAWREHMKAVGSKGGKHIHPNKGFAHPSARPDLAGRRGGQISRKPKKVVE